MMNEKLQDKVVAIELAGNNIFIANDNDNFKNELISIGFEKVEPYYSISMPIGDVEKRAVLFGLLRVEILSILRWLSDGFWGFCFFGQKSSLDIYNYNI